VIALLGSTYLVSYRKEAAIMRDKLPPIVLHPRPSHQLTLILSSLHCLSLGILVVAPITLGVKFLLILLLLLQALDTYRRLYGAIAQRISEIRINDEHATRLVFADDRVMRTRLRGDSLITNGLMLLRFDGEGMLRRPSLLLGRDSLNAAEMRRLRVLLRVGGRANKGTNKGSSCPE
jgi:hypothetical protein